MPTVTRNVWQQVEGAGPTAADCRLIMARTSPPPRQPTTPSAPPPSGPTAPHFPVPEPAAREFGMRRSAGSGDGVLDL